MRLEFDMTVDEAVDLARRAMARSKTVRAIRLRSIWISTLIAGPVLAATWILSSGSAPSSLEMWAVLLGVALFVSVLAYAFARWFYDSTTARRVRRIVVEQFGKSSSVQCEIEVQPTGLWTRQDGVEITLPWKDIEAVVDTHDAIELRFRSGLVVARNRVFSSPEQRAEFLIAVEGHAR